EVRKVIYTTNSIESLNYQLRKIIKNRGHFPNNEAAVKLLWLAIRDIEDKRARQRVKTRKDGTKTTVKRTLIEGASTNVKRPEFDAFSVMCDRPVGRHGFVHNSLLLLRLVGGARAGA